MKEDATATLPAEPETEPPPVRRAVIPREAYLVHYEHARGGFGRILRARDQRLGRDVAIKEVLAGGHAIARFEREVRVTARLQHPSIVPVYEAGTWPTGEPFYVMKFVEGRSLKELIQEAKTLEQRLALLPHLIAVADAVAYAHSRRVIHRDLKPSNVMVGAFGETQVVDWGLAKDLDDSRPDEVDAGPFRVTSSDSTGTGTVLGTPAYMPPEQAAAEPVDQRADVYALGAMLYHLLAGHTPYADSESLEVLEQLRVGPPQPLGAVVPRSARDLQAIVEKAMARRPEDRYVDAQAMAEDLRRFQSGRLVAAARYSRRQLLRRWLRRRRVPVLVALLLGGAVAAASAITYSIGQTAAACDGGEALAASVWDKDAQGKVAAAFRNTRHPSAEGALARVDAALRDRLALWAKGHREACEATRVRHEQSDAMLDLRMACLRRARNEIDVVVTQLGAVDAVGIPRAGVAAAQAGDIEECADPATLVAAAPLPRDPIAAGGIEALRVDIVRLRVMSALGQRLPAEALGREMIVRARQLGHGPTLAAALVEMGSLEVAGGDVDAGIAKLYEAVEVGSAVKDDKDVSRAMAELVFAIGSRKQRFEVAETLYQLARASVARNGAALVDVSRLLNYRSHVLVRKGDERGAMMLRLGTLALSAAIYGPESSQVGLLLGYIAGGMGHLGKSGEAVAAFERSIAMLDKTAGPDHPFTLATISNAAGNLIQRGELDRAAALLERIRETQEHAFGAEDRALARTVLKLARVRYEQRRLVEARRDAEQAVQVSVKNLGADHPDVADGYVLLGAVEMLEGKPDAAHELFAKALVIQRKAFGAEHGKISGTLEEDALALLALGRPAEARVAAEQAIAIDKKTIGEDHPDASGPLMALARVLLHERKFAEAEALYRRSHALLATEFDADSTELAEPWIGLCESLLGKGDRAGAQAAGERALAAKQAPADIRAQAESCLGRAR